MNVDFDGAPNAYSPPDKNPLDTLDHAGQNSHYYGLVSIKPDESRDVVVPGKGKQKKSLVELYNLKLDPLQPVKQGFLPVVQQGGECDGVGDFPDRAGPEPSCAHCLSGKGSGNLRLPASSLSRATA